MTMKKKPQELPKSLLKAQERFSRWRSCQKPHTCIPEKLWNTAVNLSQDHGLSKTAKALGLGYDSLKKKVSCADLPVDFDLPQSTRKNTGATFLEIFPPEHSISSECIIELEGENKTRMRISLKGSSMSDFADFSTRLWKSHS